jgi:hypothetical protein
VSFKRKVALLLAVVMILTSFPSSILAAYPSNPAEFELYLENNNIFTESKLLKPANFYTYDRYGLITYGKFNPTDDAKFSRETGMDEPRYLGYTDADQLYTNSLYPNDDRGTKTPIDWLNEHSYQDVDYAEKSWALVTDVNQKNFMLSDMLQFEGVVYNGLTVNAIGQLKAKLLNKASLRNGFSVLTEHKAANGKLYYATFYGQEMGGDTNVDCDVYTQNSTYTLKADQQTLTVPVTVTATADLRGTYVKQSHVKSLRACFGSEKSLDVGNILTATKTVNKIFSRSDLKVGSQVVYLQGNAEMVSTLSGADAYIQHGTKAITIIVEPYPNAYVDIKATVNPSSKQVDGSKDELVTVSVNASLVGYTDLSNIKNWTIYAKLDGEDLTLQTKTNAGGVLSSSANFSFTVVKSKFNADSFLQTFRTTAVVTLNRAIDGESSYQATSLPTADFYKVAPVPDPPPTGGNIKPVAVLGYEETVKAGDETGVDGFGSYDEDGYIAGYNFNTTGATVTDSGEGWRNVWYPYTGQPTKKYKVAVRVTDNKGASDAESNYITVTEPTVNAKIKVTGKLKVNRQVKITNASKSPTHYPLDINKTAWTLQAVSGGTNADIKFNGVLSKVNELNVIFNKQGVYLATLNVTNTLGYTDSTEYLINIGPDLNPVANYSTATTVIRDVNDYGNATIELLDTSYA